MPKAKNREAIEFTPEEKKRLKKAVSEILRAIRDITPADLEHLEKNMTSFKMQMFAGSSLRSNIDAMDTLQQFYPDKIKRILQILNEIEEIKTNLVNSKLDLTGNATKAELGTDQLNLNQSFGDLLINTMSSLQIKNFSSEISKLNQVIEKIDPITKVLVIPHERHHQEFNTLLSGILVSLDTFKDKLEEASKQKISLSNKLKHQFSNLKKQFRETVPIDQHKNLFLQLKSEVTLQAKDNNQVTIHPQMIVLRAMLNVYERNPKNKYEWFVTIKNLLRNNPDILEKFPEISAKINANDFKPENLKELKAALDQHLIRSVGQHALPALKYTVSSLTDFPSAANAKSQLDKLNHEIKTHPFVPIEMKQPDKSIKTKITEGFNRLIRPGSRH